MSNENEMRLRNEGATEEIIFAIRLATAGVIADETFDDKIELLSVKLQLDSKNFLFFFQRGKMYVIGAKDNQLTNDQRVEFLEKAEADFDKVIELNPKFFGGYVARANLLKDKKYRDYSEAVFGYNRAIADYSKAIELYPAFADAYRNRANLYEKTEKKDLAKQDRKKANELDGK
ncbi:MAG: tetratricopeptide repeat protein [Pyrinomonadaceae bacterium]|nr:tetratricopeptide repeat protein [Pyrinomonadaceae bacterium]